MTVARESSATRDYGDSALNAFVLGSSRHAALARQEGVEVEGCGRATFLALDQVKRRAASMTSNNSVVPKVR
jgi:hypothetical protein